jgi:hypothetical protein
VLEPFFNALKFQNSLPPTPTGGVDPSFNLKVGVSKVLLTFSSTLVSLMPVSSHLKPVVGLESKEICSKPSGARLIFLPSCDLSANIVWLTTAVIVGDDLTELAGTDDDGVD